MSKPHPGTKPILVIVSGRPGSGKTTLAHALARELRCPAICRDELKEGYINTIGAGAAVHRAAAMHVYDVFFDTIERLLRHRITLVAEAAFQHKLWAPKLEPMRELARLRVITCSIAPELAEQRRVLRHAADPHRAQFHPDDISCPAAAPAPQPAPAEFDPIHLDAPTLVVDTSDGYRPTLERVCRFVHS